MKKKLILITIILATSFSLFLPIFILTNNNVLEIIVITIGVTLYHFLMRLIVGYIINSIMKNKANYNNFWFREKRFENKLYRVLGVRKWKKYLQTYSKEIFDIKQKNIDEILGATCQAELVHEIIMVLSLLPIGLIPFFGAQEAFIITSIIAMLFDSLFVIIQRYNRPRIIKIIKREQKNNK